MRIHYVWMLAALLLGCVVMMAQQSNSTGDNKTAMKHARGTFDVKLTPQKPDSKEAESAKLGRMAISKQYHGDMEGTGEGEMLYNASPASDSGAYVAIERVTAKLDGRSGSFDLQHLGVKDEGKQTLSINVIPGSGAGDLKGVAGKLDIQIDNAGKHSYDFEYSLPEQK